MHREKDRATRPGAPSPPDREGRPRSPAEAEAQLAGMASALFPAGVDDWIQLTWQPRLDAPLAAGAGVEGESGEAQDERSLTEARLRTAELRYRTLIEQIPAVTFMAVLGEGPNEVYISPHIEALLGFTQREWLENPFLWYSQLHPEDRDLWNAEFARGIRTGGPFRAECRFIARDGRIVWVRGEARLIKDDVGRPQFLQGVAFDITESKQAQAVELEQAIRGTEQRYRDLVEHLEAIFWEVELESARFTFVSRGAERILGFPIERWLSDPEFWLSRVNEEDRPAVAGEWDRVRGSSGDHEFEFRATAADGRDVWLQTRVRRPLQVAGERYLLGVMLDVTERRQSEEERARLHREAEHAREMAESANRAKDEFLAIVSHELRTPLNALIGYAQLLRTQSVPPKLLEHVLERIERGVQTQWRLVEDLLDVSRIITGKLRLDIRPVNLSAVVDAAVEAVRLSAEARRISLIFRIDRSGLVVSGDEERLQQVVWNFLSNAVKFTPEDGRIEISLERAGHSARMRVTDSGEGMGPELIPHVFDRFRQADSSATRTHGGLGLGLSIVRHVVEAHGGVVWAESAGPGHGASFFAQLPLSLVPEEGEDVPKEAAVPSPGEHELPLDGIEILAVGADEDALDLLYSVFSSGGAVVTSAETVAVAIEQISLARPDVLVCDLGPPELDGYSLLRRVRETIDSEDLPAVAVTAHAGVAPHRKSLEVGFQHHVTKPIDVEELIAVVERLTRPGGHGGAARGRRRGGRRPVGGRSTSRAELRS